MINPPQQARFDTRTGQLIHQCLRICDYHDDLIEDDYPLSSDRILPVVTFAHRPHDARSSCMVFLPASTSAREDAAGLRELGAPIIFFVGAGAWEMWSLRTDGSRQEHKIKVNALEGFFNSHKADFAPGSVFRAKTWARAETARQLDFVDAGLLPLIEREAGTRLRQLFEDMVSHTMGALDITSDSLSQTSAHWLVKANFWLLAGKLLRDKNVPKFARLDLNDVQDVFDRVAEHYDAEKVRSNGRLPALRGAANVAASFASLRSISTETLGSLYEEALLSERTRKLFSVHRTPTYLVDYMLARLSDWITDDIGIRNCRIFEPACGHAPFLVGAVRLLSDLLPEEIATDRSARRQFLRKHVSGCDRDSFALEIARLSLTLADIPNPNGWRLDPVNDMFSGDYLVENIAKASVVLVNPPFEDSSNTAQERTGGDLRHHRNGQAAELFRRLLHSLQPGGVFGVVVPQSLLEGRPFAKIRRDLLTTCEVREVAVFPDKMFEFADVETAIILGRKLGSSGQRAGRTFVFRRVREGDMFRFETNYFATANREADITRIESSRDLSLVIPDLLPIWDALEPKPSLGKFANIGMGFSFVSEQSDAFPVGERKISLTKREGFVKGFAHVSGSPDTHLLPHLKWLNQRPDIIAVARFGTTTGQRQILLNHVRVSRSPWRIKAFIDTVGRPATDAFLLVRSDDKQWSLPVLWGLCNSPIANAFAYAHSAKKHNRAGFLEEMHVPHLSTQSAERVEAAVSHYLTAANEFSSKYDKSEMRPTTRGRSSEKKAISLTDAGPSLFDTEVGSSETIRAARERLRALHWRVDAEVLSLYSLPPELERELLDFFDGVVRVGVPFEQLRYIPSEFKCVQRLSDFLQITDEWDEIDERRCKLIEKRIREGSRSAAEEAEFKELQRLFDLHRQYTAVAPLLDEVKLRQLREDDS